ncbi:hypothetical protein ACET3Z_032352 [Daucus carota]
MKITTNSTLPLLTFFIITLFFASNVASNSWIGSKYEVACTMCSACDNPCTPSTTYSPPPPPTSSPPPPSSSTSNYPPPSSSGNNNNYYYPPPPTQPSYGTSPPGNTGVYYAPPDKYYVRPPPPNPIVPYFPFYYHSPPPPSSAHVSRSSIVVNFVTEHEQEVKNSHCRNFQLYPLFNEDYSRIVGLFLLVGEEG